MERGIPFSDSETVDLLVLGAGIHGAAVARDAALRGLRVALVEREDFGAVTSWNSFKTLHGGIRHLQHLDLRRVRRSVEQQRRFLDLAPHLVCPQEFALPTRGLGLRGKAALGAALRLHRWIGRSQQAFVLQPGGLPAGRVVDTRQLAAWVPGLDVSEYSGAAVWWDAQMQSSERMVLGFVAGAAEAGASVANHAEVERLVQDRDRVVGAVVRDTRTGTLGEIRAQSVVNCAGPAAWHLLDTVTGAGSEPPPMSRAVNVVLRRPLVEDVAVGLEVTGACGAEGSQTLFMAPWRGRSLLGTLHLPPRSDGRPEPHLSEVERLLAAVDRMLPDAKLDLDDVAVIHAGIQPVAGWCAKTRRAQPVPEAISIDHEAQGGPPGLWSLVGVKFTEAAAAAEQLVDQVCRRLGRDLPAAGGSGPPLPGGEFESLADLRSQLAVTAANLAATGECPDHDALAHLLRHHGSRAVHVLDRIAGRPELAGRLTPASPVIGAEVVHAVQSEMAGTLADVVMRRTELAARGDLDPVALERCADLMAAELGWETHQRQSECAATLERVARTQLPSGDTP